MDSKLSNQKLCLNYWGHIVHTKILLKISLDYLNYKICIETGE